MLYRTSCHNCPATIRVLAAKARACDRARASASSNSIVIDASAIGSEESTLVQQHIGPSSHSVLRAYRFYRTNGNNATQRYDSRVMMDVVTRGLPHRLWYR